MQFLHLDQHFAPYGTSIAFEQFVFSGGEPHLKITGAVTTDQPVMITTRVKAFNDLGFVLLAADALKRMGVEQLELFLPYFPAARQDRLMVEGEPLTVKIMADLINAVGFRKVHIVDPHSAVTPAVLNNVAVITNHNFVKQALDALQLPVNNCVLVAPDGGASKKIHSVAKMLEGVEVIQAGKTRDVKTGALKDFEVYGNCNNVKSYVVVDDICDGGGTFLGLAEALKAKGAEKIYLIVTHGIFSKGTAALIKLYNGIVCSNSFKEMKDDHVIQLKIVE